MFDFDLLSCLQQIPLEICERLENIRRRKQFQLHCLLFSQSDESFARKEAAVVKPEPAWI